MKQPELVFLLFCMPCDDLWLQKEGRIALKCDLPGEDAVFTNFVCPMQDVNHYTIYKANSPSRQSSFYFCFRPTSQPVSTKKFRGWLSWGGEPHWCAPCHPQLIWACSTWDPIQLFVPLSSDEFFFFSEDVFISKLCLHRFFYNYRFVITCLMMTPFAWCIFT